MEIIAPRKKITLNDAFMRMFKGSLLFRSACMGSKIFMLDKTGRLTESVNIHKDECGSADWVYEDEFMSAYQDAIDAKGN